ncbi:POU domain, class 6, transcription factor 1 [Phasianus colchicus]|uniref:POU domain, class 6, transcription factor 1 n=1 Tax=Phasianus colchicus TaxID=9054 RepID=UPI00129E91A3|nr:POU domain, class 6, transcription factor 1 [Phasianus colchicus]
MDAAAVRSQDAPLTVNEQVIVMSGHETIRVLEVGVDAAPQGEEERRAAAVPPGGSDLQESPARDAGTEDGQPGTETQRGTETAGKAKPPTGAPAGTTGTVSPSSSQQPQPLAPLAVQAAPQVLTQENLATVVTGVMVPAGTVTQPLLIPISIAGQVAGQQGLAVWTFPTATVAALPGLTAASPTGGIFKPPIANLQAAAAVLNTAIPAPLPPAQPRPPPQPQSSYPSQPPPILPQPNAAPAAKPLETQPQIAVQPAGFAFNPGIIGAASLGGQTQLLGSLAAAPVIANTIPSVQSIAGQLLTNAQGQVIGTLPWVVNPPGIAAASPAPTPSLQVQAVTPQLLLNAQGQVIATLASGTIQAATGKKSGPPETPSKSEVSAGHGEGVLKNHGTTGWLGWWPRRFEKLDITPKSAQKLKPVLEKWLSEAELRNQEGQQNLMEFVGGEPSKKRKRRTSFTPQAIEALNAYFEKNALPTGQEITEIAKELNYDREVVRVWFCNRRQTLKNTSKLNVFQIP